MQLGNVEVMGENLHCSLMYELRPSSQGVGRLNMRVSWAQLPRVSVHAAFCYTPLSERRAQRGNPAALDCQLQPSTEEFRFTNISKGKFFRLQREAVGKCSVGHTCLRRHACSKACLLLCLRITGLPPCRFFFRFC